MVKNVELGAQDAVENLVQEIDEFYGTSTPNDDRTLVIFNVLGEDSAVFDVKETFREGKRFLLEKNFRRALREFQKIIHRDPTHAEAQYLAGQCSSFLTEYASAEKFLVEAIKLAPSNYKALYYTWALSTTTPSNSKRPRSPGKRSLRSMAPTKTPNDYLKS
jgi:tetratricopeptide (TPR) repeat protein